MKTWYEIRAQASDVAQVLLYGVIGRDPWTGDGTPAAKFVSELSAITAPQIELRLNSPGGDTFDGTAIYNALLRHPATVTTFIDGLAASIASVIALAGQKVVMAANALYMIHNPSGLVWGPAADMRKTADLLDKVRDTLVGTYAAKTKKSSAEIEGLLDAESWFDAAEAKAAGFVDEVSESAPAVAAFDPRAVQGLHVPDRFAARIAAMTLRPAPIPSVQAAAPEAVLQAVAAVGGAIPIARALIAAKASPAMVAARCARLQEVQALCRMARQARLAPIFMEADVPVSAVKAILTDVTAQLDGIEIDTSLPPDGAMPGAALDVATIYARRREEGQHGQPRQ